MKIYRATDLREGDLLIYEGMTGYMWLVVGSIFEHESDASTPSYLGVYSVHAEAICFHPGGATLVDAALLNECTRIARIGE